MTVECVKGDLFDPSHPFDAIGHGVNCFGVMGSGIAVEFKKRYPEMYHIYNNMCKRGYLLPGQVYPYRKVGQPNSLAIYNIASQFRPGPDARLTYLEAGLEYVKFHMKEHGYRNLGLPRIGAGIGGLNFDDVYATVDDVFGRSRLNVTIVSL